MSDGQDGHGAPGRDEDETQRVDRNWSELRQELRVTQTGVQLLAGFLLTLIPSVVAGTTAAYVAGVALGVFLVSLWFALPLGAPER